MLNDISKFWILKGIGFNGFIVLNDSDWDDVRVLGIVLLLRLYLWVDLYEIVVVYKNNNRYCINSSVFVVSVYCDGVLVI